MGGSSSVRVSLAVLVVLLAALLGITISSPPLVHAAAGLPRTYSVTKVDSPDPDVADRFGDGFVNGGDVNGDGEDDLLVGIDEHGTYAGEVFILDGTNGNLIRSVPAPDASNGGRPAAWGTYVGKIEDLGSCPGGSPGQPCAANPIGGIDGIDDHLVSAIGVDVDNVGDDMGRVYVLDGATSAILKKIQMPAADRAHQASVPTNQKTDPRTGFGGTILAPAGLPPCEGNMGVGPCDTGIPPTPGAPAPPYPEEVRIGDVDGEGFADIVVGARSYHETGPASNPRCDPGPCTEAGRFYVYAGEDVAASNAATVLETPLFTIKNPMAQSDDPDTSPRYFREAMGYSVAPLGDVGRCTNGTKGVGDYCMGANMTTTQDGRPDWVASAHRVDMFGMGDVGVGFVIDGRTSAIINVLTHPEPQPTSIFAFSNYNQPAVGDVASSLLPDSYQGAMVQNVNYRAEGRGYVVNADAKFMGGNHATLSVLSDPTPNAIGNFGTSSAGVGDLSGDSHKEVMVGAYGPHAPGITSDVISDVHIFDPISSEVLQTIADPDQHPGSGFGRALAPLGDLNDDGFLDFAVGAGGYDPATLAGCAQSPCTDAGRIYIFTSDNSAPPPEEFDRAVSLQLRRHLVARGFVTASDAGAPAGCTVGATVAIKRNGQLVEKATTDEDGFYRAKLPDRQGTYVAIARRLQTTDFVCERAKSPKREHNH